MSDNDDPAAKGGFHVDKRIPLALIMALLVYASATIWWAATMNARMGVVEVWVLSTQTVGDRLTTIEVLQETVLDKLEIMDDRLMKIEEKP